MRTAFRFLFGLAFLVLCAPLAHAAVVTKVARDGTLTLDGGKEVFLVGVRLDDDGISILRVLTQGQDLRLQLIAGPDPKAREAAYAYLQAKYLNFPVKPKEIPDEKEVLLNEFLIRIGAAKVAEDHDFGRKEDFLKVQEEAKKKGEGVWSYEAR